MSVSSAPVNPLLAQPKPPAQGNNAPEEAATPFASVLQQKVKTGKSEGKSEDSASQANAAAPNQPAATDSPAQSNEASAEAPTAATVVNGDYAQTALQQLLPWLQSMQQGAGAKAETTDTSETLLPQADTLVPQVAVQAAQVEPQQLAARKDKDGEHAELPIQLLKDKEAANGAANLAAPTDALTANDKSKQQSQEGFDAALQGANDRVNAQTAHTGAAANAGRSGEPARMQAPLGSPQWQNELGDRVHLMSRNNESHAELVLTPPQLGRIEVSLNISGDQASALFVSANPEVRTALEGAMDRLREVLAESGISLGQAQVGAESSGQTADNGGGESGNRRGGQMAGGVAEAATSAAWTRHSNNMLDVFA